MKGQDIVILLKLISLETFRQNKLTDRTKELHHRQDANASPFSGISLSNRPLSRALTTYDNDPSSVRSLEASLGISKSEISNSLNRSLESGLAIYDRHTKRPKPNRKALKDFIFFGIKYVFPVQATHMTRGMPTGVSAPILRNHIQSAGTLVYVWSDIEARDMGLAVEPLFKSVPYASRLDDYLYNYLALVDAIRLGNPREVKIASNLFDQLIEA